MLILTKSRALTNILGSNFSFTKTLTIFSSSNSELEVNLLAKVPISQLTSNSGASKMQMLIGNYNHYLNMIRSVTGLNEARDGSTPDPNSLVGVQKLAALNSNTATRHILDGSLFITKTLADCISLRFKDVLEYHPKRDAFILTGWPFLKI